MGNLQERGDFTWRVFDCEELVGVTWRLSDCEELVGVPNLCWKFLYAKVFN